jgi:hypothetical protein
MRPEREEGRNTEADFVAGGEEEEVPAFSDPLTVDVAVSIAWEFPISICAPTSRSGGFRSCIESSIPGLEKLNSNEAAREAKLMHVITECSPSVKPMMVLG